MTMLNLVLAIALLGGAMLAIVKFNEHCDEKFGFRFFTEGKLKLIFGSTLALFFGVQWYKSSVASGGDALNGMVLGSVGVLGVLYCIYLNFRSTNFVYGFFGSIVQVTLFSILAYLSIPVLLIALVFMFIGKLPEPPPTQVIYQRPVGGGH